MEVALFDSQEKEEEEKTGLKSIKSRATNIAHQRMKNMNNVYGVRSACAGHNNQVARAYDNLS